MAERTTAAGICIHVPLELVTDESITPWAKLVYLALASFADFKTAEAHPSIRAISKRCGVGVNVTQKAVNELASCGWIVRDSGRNSLPRVNRYRVNRERSPVQQSMLRQEEYCATENVAPGGILRQAQFECCATGNNNVAPGANELLPENNYQRTTTNNARRASTRTKTSELIYQAYPRHVGKAKALLAIGKALALIEARNGVPDAAAWLLERVQAFAKSPSGHAGQFTPHPATWFNQARYDDDPAEWSRNDGSRTTRLPITSDLPDYDANAIRAVPHAVASQR